MATEVDFALKLNNLEGNLVEVKGDVLLATQLVVEVQKQVNERLDVIAAQQDAISGKQDELLTLLKRQASNGHG